MINKGKCQILNLNCDPIELGRWATFMGCEAGDFCSFYLKFSLRHNPMSITF